ncbi:hypothetical protein A2U01_0080774, partial [Trifolium medium]|nr:hypothetical protein [Trifolium medium]
EVVEDEQHQQQEDVTEVSNNAAVSEQAETMMVGKRKIKTKKRKI